MKWKVAMITWSITLVLLSVSFASCFNDSATDFPESKNFDEISRLFTDLEEKNTPVWKCNGWQNGIRWRIPKMMDCTMPGPIVDTKVVGVTLFMPDLNEQNIQGYECYAIKTEKWVYRGFFNAKDKDSIDTYVAITADECWKMVHKRIAPNGIHLESEKNAIVGTYKSLILESKWWRNITGSVTNYYFATLQIAVTELDQSIQSTTLLSRPCKYTEGSCSTHMGVLVWNSKDVKVCRLREGEKTKCIYATGEFGVRLTCADLELSLHDIGHLIMCNKTFGASSQGIYFAQDNLGDLDDTILTPEMVRHEISAPLVKKRSKREIAYHDYNTQSSFINGKFNYLYNIISENSEFVQRQFHYEICKVNQRNLQMVRYLAESGHPTLIPRYFFEDLSYRASLSGDIITIWKCDEIKEYQLLPREACTYEWPVTYLLNNEQRTGYITPISHTITSTPTYMEDPCNEFYFDADKYLVMLTNEGAFEVNMHTLPIPGDDHKKYHHLPVLSFKSNIPNDVNRKTDIGNGFVLLQEVQQKLSFLKHLQEKQGEHETDRKTGFFEAIGVSFVSFAGYFPTFIQVIGGLLLSAGSLFWIVGLLGKFALIRKLISFLPIQSFNCFNRQKQSESDVESVACGTYDKHAYKPSAPDIAHFQHTPISVPHNRKAKPY